MLGETTLAAAVAQALAAEQDELLAHMVAARREPDPAKCAQLQAATAQARMQYRHNQAASVCTEVRLRRLAVQRMMARLLGESPAGNGRNEG